MNNKILIGGIIAIPLVSIFVMYLKTPKAKILINKDGSGLAILGSKSANFPIGQGVVLRTWNGWQLSASSSNFSLKKMNKVYTSGTIGEYGNVNPYIEIIKK